MPYCNGQGREAGELGHFCQPSFTPSKTRNIAEQNSNPETFSYLSKVTNCFKTGCLILSTTDV